MEIDETEMEVLDERDGVLLLRAPLPGEPLPELDAALDTRCMWLPLVRR